MSTPTTIQRLLLLQEAMIIKNQVAHVRAERNAMAETVEPWVVALHYSFQVRAREAGVHASVVVVVRRCRRAGGGGDGAPPRVAIALRHAAHSRAVAARAAAAAYCRTPLSRISPPPHCRSRCGLPVRTICPQDDENL